MNRFDINELVLDQLIEGTVEGLAMSNLEPRPIGVSIFPKAHREYSVIVTFSGNYSGMIFLNFSESTATFLAARLLDEDTITEINDDVLDAICEIGNIIAGSLKIKLQGTEFEIKTISLPALIVGANYNLHHQRNITTICAEFEIPEIPLSRLHDKFFTTSIAFMKK